MIIIPVLQMKKLKVSEIKEISQRNLDSKCWS